MSRLHFFKSGLTKACLKLDGTIPEERESFIIVVIDSTMLSIWVNKSDVGIGSRKHDFGEDERITFLTVSILTGSKQCIFIPLK